jgi:outer membrane protein assembly factor BamB
VYRRLRSIIVIQLALLGLAQYVFPEDWPRWRGPRGDGSWQGPRLPDKWPETGLRRVWRQAIGGGFAGVAVADGRVFTLDRLTEPDEVERVICFAATTGRLVWEHRYPVQYGKLDYGNGPRAAPTVLDGRVYTLGAVGHACCLDVETGKLIWSHDMISEFGARLPEWGFAASPVIFENLVIIHTGAEPDGSYIAFDRSSGDEVWRNLSDPAGYCTPIVAVQSGQAQLICWTPEKVCSLEPRTGQLNWSVPYKVTYGVSIATPIFQDGTVFVSGYWEGAKAIRLGVEPSQHDLIWEDNRWLRGLMSQPLYRDGHAYLLDKQHGLVCFEMKTGKKIWDDGNQMTPRGRNPHASLVWLDAGTTNRVIILNSEGELILARLDPGGYHEQSRTRIIESNARNPVWSHPAYAGSHVYARNDHEIVCISLLDKADQ